MMIFMLGCLYSFAIFVPHFGQAISMHRWPVTCDVLNPHFGQTQLPPGPEPGLLPAPRP
jgi:hypothetical protein